MSYTFTWTQGRRLATAVKGSTIASYTYNESGIRTSKTVDGTKHTYVLNGTSVYSDTWKEGSITHVVVYIYDENGSPIGMMYRNSTMGEGVFEYYIFAKNLQGDIIAVYNSNGTKLVSYKYDAWGNVTCIYSNGGDSTAVRYNSFRYRGYFYDEETGLYYLNSRYYDPATGRFLNPDIYVNANGDLTGFNMYAYCSNNPVMGYDPTGEFNWGKLLVSGSGAIAVGIMVASALNPVVGVIVGIVSYTVMANTYAVVESTIIVSTNNAEAMSKEEYNIAKQNEYTTAQLKTNEQKLRYIRACKKYDEEEYENWSEAQMLREFDYHNQFYYASSIDLPCLAGINERARHVDFEKDQTAKTYIRRYIGNFLTY